MASNTGCTSVGERLITPRISAVAVRSRQADSSDRLVVAEHRHEDNAAIATGPAQLKRPLELRLSLKISDVDDPALQHRPTGDAVAVKRMRILSARDFEPRLIERKLGGELDRFAR